MLVEKEIISPGTYWYTDEVTGLPRKLDVTPELTQYWHDQGGKMLGAGLTIPVPFEHDFDSHPMTPKDKLLNNAGWVKEYRLHDGKGGKGDKLFGIVDVQDEEIAKKLPRTIRWTSPWINSFTDGTGRVWNNVISHLALTTRPRITKQTPFSSITAALSLAADVKTDIGMGVDVGKVFIKGIPKEGVCLSKAGKLVKRKRDQQLRPQYPIAFSMFSGGIRFAENDDMKALKDNGDEDVSGDNVKMDNDSSNDDVIDLPPFNDPSGDVTMEELLCDLLGALGIHCEQSGNEQQFKRSLYTAAMMKINELTSKAQDGDKPKPGDISNNALKPPATATGQPNPLIQQEQQPMYMSLEEINRITDPTMRTIALSMYNENAKLTAQLDAQSRVTASLRDVELRKANAQRVSRVLLLGKMSPRVKADLDAMLALPSMALSMGDGGAMVDPMAQTLAVLEKGLVDMPRLLTVEQSALSVQQHPTDGEMSAEQIDKMADDFSRMMGCLPEKKIA